VNAWLAPALEALDETDRPVRFFFRDDDVGWNDEALWPLLDVFAELELPIDLAVIPTEVSPGSASRLLARNSQEIGLHQHGLAHVNHEEAGRKNEFGPARSKPHQREDIVDGRRRLSEAFGDAVDSIFSPPWNRCVRPTAECLVELGFAVLSREAKSEPFEVDGLVELPINIDWFAHRKRVRLSRDEFGGLVAAAVRAGDPVGVMFHHAAMDGGERQAASELLSLVADHPMARTFRMRALARG
jgi:hypothetical protein